MNQKQRAILTVLAFMLILGAITVSAATRTIIIHVKGMTCGGCAVSVEEALKSTDGVTDARVSFKSGKAVIKYDDQKVTIAKLREVITNTGFSCDANLSPGRAR